MALSFLFRFRDFIAPTIDEHKAITGATCGTRSTNSRG